MTITAQTAKSGPYTGNGSTTVFAYAFKALAEGDLVVTQTVTSTGVETVKSLSTHYSVSGVGVNGGGNVTMSVAPPSGTTLTITRAVALTQGTDLVNRGAVQPVVLEDGLDRLTQINQDVTEKLVRSLVIPVSSATSVDPTLAAPGANESIIWNATADALVAGPTSSEISGASASATAAAASATAAAASYDSFDDRYLGAKSSDPATDNDGDALVTGALYWNTSTNQMFAYTGSAWAAIKPTSGEQTNINTVAADASDIGAVAGKETEIGRLGTSDAVADLALLGTSAAVADMAILGTTDVVADMNTLGTADVVSDMNTLGTSDAVSDMNTLAAIASDITSVAADATDIGAVAAKATEIGRLGTADAVADMAILGTTDVVADLAILGTTDVVADMAILGTSDVVTDMNTLGTADVVTDMNTLGTADVVTDMNTLGTADVVTDMNTLGTSANVTNMATVAANVAGVNSFAERYRVASSDPGSSLDAGDLVFNTTSSALKYYTGSAWVAVTAPDVTLADTVALAVALG
jgi:hypothetical protein